MSREESPKEDLQDLNELEAALRALVPRAQRLDRDLLMFMAGQASVEISAGGCHGDARVAIRQRQHAHASVGMAPKRLPGACFSSIPGWAWPAALAAMTGVAASLLVALAIRPAPRVVERIVERTVTVPAAPQEPAAAVAERPGRVGRAQRAPPAMQETAAALPHWLTWEPFPRPGVGAEGEPSYPELRRQVLLHGLESWKPLASESPVAGRGETWPAAYREQLNRWLEEQRRTSGARS
jgi:hypothetical protein